PLAGAAGAFPPAAVQAEPDRTVADHRRGRRRPRRSHAAAVHGRLRGRAHRRAAAGAGCRRPLLPGRVDRLRVPNALAPGAPHVRPVAGRRLALAHLPAAIRRRRTAVMKSLLRPVFRALPDFFQQLIRHPAAPFSRPIKYVNSLIYHLYGYRLFGSPWEGIQLGGGPTPIKSFCNIDASIFCPADVIAGISRLKVPTGSVHPVYTRDTLEHIPRLW